ncbi:MAG: hypothetical protein GY913_15430 [Proteobacteria bacterium]|nr:hypothetical protein [Pseudomonadota bacterium]MCP4918300.1 hypothetical protein [Pseudomonadota bacterium]
MLLLLACAPDPDPTPVVEPVVDEVVEPVVEATDEPVEDIEVVDTLVEEPTDDELDEEGVEEVDVEGSEDAELLAPITDLDATAWTDPQELIAELSGLPYGTSVQLTEDVRIAGVPCKGVTRLEAYTEGGWSCVLSEPATVSDWPFDRGTRLQLHANGAVAHATFGDLRSPREMVTIGGIPCLSRAALHATGTVKACTLARGSKFGSITLPRGSDVTLRDDGGLVDATLYEATSVAGTRYEAGLLLFDGAGAVAGHQPGVFGD